MSNTKTKKKKPVKKSKQKYPRAYKIYKRAKLDAFPYGTKKSIYAYPNGHAKKQFRIDLKKAFPNRKDWEKQRAKGAACDVFTSTVIRASGIDLNFPSSITKIDEYCKKNSKKWKRLRITNRKKMRRGDIIVQFFKNGQKRGNRHVSIYLGGNRIANAHAKRKTYGVIEAYNKIIKPKKKCESFLVYRIREKSKKKKK